MNTIIKPKVKDYALYSEHAIHAAMDSWARSQDKKLLQVTVAFIDNSVFIDTFERAIKEVFYKTLDNEKYSVCVDTGKFINPYLNAPDVCTSKEIKEAFNWWIGAGVKSIKWEYIAA